MGNTEVGKGVQNLEMRCGWTWEEVIAAMEWTVPGSFLLLEEQI
jgi:hypothetical protein